MLRRYAATPVVIVSSCAAEQVPGWTGPKMVDGLPVEGTFRSHQVPLLVDPEHPDHLAQLESWVRGGRLRGNLRTRGPIATAYRRFRGRRSSLTLRKRSREGHGGYWLRGIG
jgi:phosphoketolase